MSAETATLFCSKSPGMFSSELIFDVYDRHGDRHQFFADESWAAPFGVRVDIRELSPDGQLMLVGLPNGQGSIVVHRSQIGVPL